ncbi:MAG: hypothetical protein ACYCW7_17400 [Pseudomonadaceae bacterium]|jgi:hypothetical protein
MERTKRLSQTQLKVMKWLGNGWSALPGSGSAVMVNGRRICNVDTMQALERQGLVTKDEDRRWDATDHGKEFAKALGL